MARGRRVVAWMIFALVASTHAATAADWPQWGGPGRDFVASGTDLLDSWADDKPKELWRRPLGNGRAAIVVYGDTLYTMYGGKKREAVVAPGGSVTRVCRL